MRGLNVKGLVQQIKSSKDSIVWSFENGIHFISDRHWAIKLEQLPKEVSIALFSIFAEYPEPGDTFVNFGGIARKNHPISAKSAYEAAERGKPGIMTNFLEDGMSIRCRIFKSDLGFSFINENMLKAINHADYEGELLVGGEFDPVFFKDLNYIVLPVRKRNFIDFELLGSLLGNAHELDL